MEIYAEITKKMLEEINDGKKMIVPLGISLRRKEGSRACYFECGEGNEQILMDFLDANGLAWQEI